MASRLDDIVLNSAKNMAKESFAMFLEAFVSAMPYGVSGSNAISIAANPGSTTKMVIFGYESGATMVGLTAPARRVGFWFNDTSATNATSGGWSLFDAAVQWSTNTP